MIDAAFRIVDFEASSLSGQSYPIEVGWCDLDGAGESHLIKPEPGWIDWDPRSEEVHGISREKLLTEGRPAQEVAKAYGRANGGAYLYADGIAFDQRWSDRLLQVARMPRLKILAITELYLLALRPLLDKLNSPLRLPVATKLVRDAEQAAADRHPVRHRALEDARRLAATHGALAARVAELLS
jgi:DNA polymerase III epsilon subunit-like protein